MRLQSNNFVKVCNIQDILPNQVMPFFLEDREIIICCDNNNYYAFDNNCPHQNSPILHQGFIEDSHIVCPNHMFQFNLATGNMQNSNLRLTMHKVIIENDFVYVKLCGDE